MTAPAVTALVLDLGQVVVRWEPHRAWPELDQQAFTEIADRIGFHALNLRADAGQSWADLEAETAARWPEHAGFVGRYPQGFPATLTGLVPGMTELIAAVQETGLPVYGLTNWSAETYPHGVAAAPVIQTFAGVVVSGQEGLVKPDPAIYRLLLTRYRLVAASTLFVDDRPENVAAAEQVGLAGHVFTGAAELRRILTARGVLPPTLDR